MKTPKFDGLIIVKKDKVQMNENIDRDFLSSNKFYKMLSLVEAYRDNIKVPPTLLIVEQNNEAIQQIVDFWKLPLMLRIEYKTRGDRKFLGGIPIFKENSIYELISFLRSKGYYTILHPNINRFEDIYSVGILLEQKKSYVYIEVVGEGFDASDLRLGQTIPHEYLKINMLDFSVEERHIIPQELYYKERQKRIEKIKKLLSYIEFVNKNNKLLYSLEDLLSDIEIQEPPVVIPTTYNPLPRWLINSLVEICSNLYFNTIKRLPRSETFAASLTNTKKDGWILWDIYGGWYAR